MDGSSYDKVHTITEWYDGAREGIADLNGGPHYYKNNWDSDNNDWSEIYLLMKIDEKTFGFALEDWQIWLNWEKAFKEDKTTQKTHPALPIDKARHKILAKILKKKLAIRPETSIKAKAKFKYGKVTLVKWTVIA